MIPGEVWIGHSGKIVRIIEAGEKSVTVKGIENAHNWNRIGLGVFLNSYRPATPHEMDWIAELPQA